MTYIRLAILLLVATLSLLVTPAAFAIDECFHCVKVETFQTVCYVWNWWNGTRTVFNCAYPPSFNPVTESPMSVVVPKETGFKRQIITATYYPATIMDGHSASFQAWWNDRLNAPPGSGSSGPSESYNTDVGGTSSASSTWVNSQEYTADGVPYTLKTWYCAQSGQSCQKSVYIYGTDGE